MTQPAEIPFQQLVDALLDTDTPLHPRYLYRLSDLEDPELSILKSAWPKLPLWRRQALMEDIEDLSNRDTLLSFVSLASFAAQDEDAKVRLLAVHTLWDYDESNLIPVFLDMLNAEEDAKVRAAVAGALGQYVYAGEVDEIPTATLQKIEDALLDLTHSDQPDTVRRSALESLGFSSRDEIPSLIEQAFASDDKDWKASALLAMGRSANSEWNPHILTMLESPHPLLRSEAARAAGELEISDALPLLLELLDDPDEATRLASIWSLSQIGGEEVREILEQMYEDAEEEQEISFLEDALDNLMFTEGSQLMPLFDFPDSAEDDLDLLVEDDEDLEY
jgi:HEAT repeat protein